MRMSIESVIESLSLSRSAYSDRGAFLHRCRVELEPFIYSYLRDRYGKVLSDYWKSCTIPRKSDKAIIIVERRCHPNLEFTIQNAVYFARGYSLHIVCSEANKAFVEEICSTQCNSVHIHPVYKDIGTAESGKKEYNLLLKSYGFWSSFSEEYILCMETDSYLLRPIPDSIYKYHYVASKWHWVPEQAGGGGITHRRRSFMLEISTLDSLQGVEMQDCFASEGLLSLGYPVCSEDIFGEAYITDGLIGTHQWWTFICDDIHNIKDAVINLILEIDSTPPLANSPP